VNYSLLTDPWPHLVIDNYFDDCLAEKATKEIIDFIKASKPKNKQTVIRSTDYDFEQLFPVTKQYISSNIVNESLLSIFPRTREYTTLNTYSEINICLGDFSYPIHDENTAKVLSAVTYLFPKVSRGTLIYDSDKNFYKEVEWKQNRTLIFAPLDDITWHSYEVSNIPVRITINSFLIR
jgi:hypothetical protein